MLQTIAIVIAPLNFIVQRCNINRKKPAFKLHLGLDHDGLIPAFASVTLGKIGHGASAAVDFT